MLSYYKKLLTIGTVIGILLSSANVWANDETARLNTADSLSNTDNRVSITTEAIMLADASDFQTFQERTRQVKS